MNLEETKIRLSTIELHIDEFRKMEAVQKRRLNVFLREAKRLRQMLASEAHRQAAG